MEGCVCHQCWSHAEATATQNRDPECRRDRQHVDETARRRYFHCRRDKTNNFNRQVVAVIGVAVCRHGQGRGRQGQRRPMIRRRRNRPAGVGTKEFRASKSSGHGVDGCLLRAIVLKSPKVASSDCFFLRLRRKLPRRRLTRDEET